jgi:CRISPR-associated protein Cas4
MEHEAWRRFYSYIDRGNLSNGTIRLTISKSASEALDWALIGFDHYPSSLRSHLSELEVILSAEAAQITSKLDANVPLDFVLPVFTEASLASTKFGIRGRIDLVYKSQDGYEPWDIKTGRPPSEMFDSYKLQVTAYALLLEANYKCQVKSGGLRFTGLRVDESFPISQQLREQVIGISEQIHKMLQFGERPAVERLSLPHCKNCGFRKVCQELVEEKVDVRDN